MADFTLTQNISMALYRYICQNIVGSEKHVKTIRLMNIARDNLLCDNRAAVITSGSFGEGLDMKGSDLDLMFVQKGIEVYEGVQPNLNTSKTYVAMETDNVKPGFTQLLLKHARLQFVFDACEKINGKYYCSSALYKDTLMAGQQMKIHRPCISDDDGWFDHAFCFHCKSWISIAKQWIRRSNNSWPNYNVKQMIIKHGVLFVPIGVQEKCAPKEDIEWRISFSVGEKLLMNTFRHTQLLCYALLKILMKDVIASFSKCQDLLCSYFLKTIIFWVSEELLQPVWKPENLIPCFMRCFNRLVYCVKYSVCQHYFIPENNMFENKIEGPAREILLEKLYTLRSYGWRCILFSDQVSSFRLLKLNSYIEPHTFHVNEVEKILNSNLFTFANSYMCTVVMKGLFLLKRGIQQIVSSDSSSIKHFISYYTSMFCSSLAQTIPLVSSSSNNKYQYRQYTFCLTLMLRNIYHDAVSGWLMLASCFYKTKQYDKALHVIVYAISKCSPEKLYRPRDMVDIHHQLLKMKALQNKNVAYLCKILFVDFINFDGKCELIPDELTSERINGGYFAYSRPYAYFLKWLCHYHLNHVRQCQNSLKDLERVIGEQFFIADFSEIANAYNMIGIALQLSGDTELARQAFLQSINSFPYHEFNPAYKRLFPNS